jgi:hypothetical protein
VKTGNLYRQGPEKKPNNFFRSRENTVEHRTTVGPQRKTTRKPNHVLHHLPYPLE